MFILREDSGAGKTTLASKHCSCSIRDKLYWLAKCGIANVRAEIWDLYGNSTTCPYIQLDERFDSHNLVDDSGFVFESVDDFLLELQAHEISFEEAAVLLSTGRFVQAEGTHIKSSALSSLEDLVDCSFVSYRRFGVQCIGAIYGVKDNNKTLVIKGAWVSVSALSKAQITDGLNWVLLEGVSMCPVEYEMPRTIDAPFDDQVSEENASEVYDEALRRLCANFDFILKNLGDNDPFKDAVQADCGELTGEKLVDVYFVKRSHKFPKKAFLDSSEDDPDRKITADQIIQDIKTVAHAKGIVNTVKRQRPVDTNKTNVSTSTFVYQAASGRTVSVNCEPMKFVLNVQSLCWLDSALMFVLAPDKVRLKGSGSASFVQALLSLTYNSAVLFWPHLGSIDPFEGSELDGILTGDFEASKNDGMLDVPVTFEHRLTRRGTRHLFLDELFVSGHRFDVAFDDNLSLQARHCSVFDNGRLIGHGALDITKNEMGPQITESIDYTGDSTKSLISELQDYLSPIEEEDVNE